MNKLSALTFRYLKFNIKRTIITIKDEERL